MIVPVFIGTDLVVDWYCWERGNCGMKSQRGSTSEARGKPAHPPLGPAGDLLLWKKKIYHTIILGFSEVVSGPALCP
jgi:hypothetical protein